MNSPFNKVNEPPSLNTRFMVKYSFLNDLFSKHYHSGDIVNIFIDVRSTVSSVFTPAGIEMIQKHIRFNDRYLYARSIVKLVNHYSRYLKNNKISQYNIILFSEMGDSLYHIKLNPDYKKKRSISKLKRHNFDEASVNNISDYIQNNIEKLTKVFNNTPHVYFFNLLHLEADFIPNYIIDQYTDRTKEDYLNIIISSDKDFAQCITSDTVQISYRDSDYDVYTLDNWEDLFNTKKLKNFIPSMYITPKFAPILMAIVGDTADDIKGLFRVGFKSAYDYIEDLYKKGIFPKDFSYTMDEFIDLIKIHKLDDKISTSILKEEKNMVINYKLISFNALQESISIDKQTFIKNIVENKENQSVSKLKEAYETMCGHAGFYLTLLN